MRWRTLLENQDPVEKLIDSARFTGHDRDIGTYGYCGMFALALYEVLKKQGVNAELVLINPSKDGVTPNLDRDGMYFWHQAAVKVGNNYYDIDGKQELSWMFDNYCWETPAVPQRKIAGRKAMAMSTVTVIDKLIDQEQVALALYQSLPYSTI